MKTFTLEQIAQITGGMLSKAKDVAITKIAPPLLADEEKMKLTIYQKLMLKLHLFLWELI